MLELKTYTKTEMSAILRTSSRDGIKRKLDRYEVGYTIEGRGDFKITITEIRKPFKLYCILDLGISAQSDFDKMLWVMYFLINDAEFSAMPNERRETYLAERGFIISRQTIRTCLRRVEKYDWLAGEEYVYYFAYEDRVIPTTEETYKEAWKQYWKDNEEGGYQFATYNVIETHGGMPRKACKEYLGNAFYTDEINAFIKLVNDSFEAEFSQTFNSKISERDSNVKCSAGKGISADIENGGIV